MDTSSGLEILGDLDCEKDGNNGGNEDPGAVGDDPEIDKVAPVVVTRLAPAAKVVLQDCARSRLVVCAAWNDGVVLTLSQ